LTVSKQDLESSRVILVEHEATIASLKAEEKIKVKDIEAMAGKL